MVGPHAERDEDEKQEREQRHRRRLGARGRLARSAQIREQRGVYAGAPLGEELDVDSSEEGGDRNGGPAVGTKDDAQCARGEQRREGEQDRGDDEQVRGCGGVHAGATEKETGHGGGGEMRGLGRVIGEEDDAEEREEEEPEERVAE